MRVDRPTSQNLRPDVVVRAGLALLAALNLGWGVWARLWPRNFFDRFPGFGRHWTSGYPPYNEHLVTDLGATFLTLGIMLAVAAALNDRRVSAVVLSGVLCFALLHLSYHVWHAGDTSATDRTLSIATLAAGVLVPLALLVRLRRS